MCFFLIVTISTTKVSSQNYSVGTPVNDTLTISQYYSFDNCYPEPVFSLTFPYSTVTGIEHILIFTSVNPANSINTVSGDTINVGDTLHFSQSQNTFTFYFPSNGTINYIFKAIGTPQIANETYACGSWVWTDGATICSNFRYFMYFSTCIVSGISSLKDNSNSEPEFLIYPNPANTSFEITKENNQIIKEVGLYTIEGKLIKQKTFSENKIKVDTSELPAGMYVIEAQTKEKRMFQKLIISH